MKSDRFTGGDVAAGGRGAPDLRRYVLRDADGNVARQGRVYPLGHPDVKGRIGRTGESGDGLMITFCNRAPRGLDGPYIFIPQVPQHEMKHVEIVD